jgi:hypothetical protein
LICEFAARRVFLLPKTWGRPKEAAILVMPETLLSGIPVAMRREKNPVKNMRE